MYGKPCPVVIDWVAIPPTAIMASRPFNISEACFFFNPSASLGANLYKPKSMCVDEGHL
jgi:hypothetical protein